jgi:hypothetical protein
VHAEREHHLDLAFLRGDLLLRGERLQDRYIPVGRYDVKDLREAGVRLISVQKVTVQIASNGAGAPP